MTRDAIRFLRGDRLVEVRDLPPRTTLLDWLRLEEGSRGTKEGCNEGDCGACTVVLVRDRGGRLAYQAVNSCILLVGQADGAQVITVEDLATGGELHPVQDAMVRHHGSQCGFCTPGIVMSLFALHHRGDGPVSREEACDALAGNLCRCTGYRPIIEAAVESCAGHAADHFAQREAETLAALRALADGRDVLVGDEESFFAAPAGEESLAAILEAHPDATILAGATDVGLWITKQLLPLRKIAWLGRVPSLREIEAGDDAVILGAGVTHAEAMPVLAGIDPDLGELMRRFGSEQVRVSGTVGGNVANGSPIGDLPPALIALGASVDLRRGDRVRTLPLEDFFIAYRKQDREPGEFVRRLVVPRPAKGEHVRVFKVSKRRDEDITAVLMACRIGIEDGTIISARVAFGGMAETPKRAPAVEAALVGAAIGDGEVWTRAGDAVARDFKPLDDLRASAAYRLIVARNLVVKACAEIAGAPSAATRLSGWREVAHAAE